MVTSTASSSLAYFLFGLAAYNLSKLPWYLGALPIPSYGLEASMPFHLLAGYRGSKLWSHPVLFLAPHVVMGSTLLICHSLYLLEHDKSPPPRVYFGLALLFALHVFPERAGIPNRSKKLPLNEACMILIGVATALTVAGWISESAGRITVIVPCVGAAVLELLPVCALLVKKIKSPGYQAQSKDGDQPLKRNMNGYSGICPFAKLVDISTSEYPSSRQD